MSSLNLSLVCDKDSNGRSGVLELRYEYDPNVPAVYIIENVKDVVQEFLETAYPEYEVTVNMDIKDSIIDNLGTINDC